jgi:CheY-like chemotaxis protein
MSEEVLAHIFEPFFSTKGVGKGVGLGLATVHGVITQNEGFIDVTSAPGAGTTFSIYLPPHLGTTDTRPSDAPAAASDAARGTILLVEDEPAVMQLTERVLTRLGYTVVATTSAHQAMTLADEHAGRFDLLMTDVVMPEMDGRELASILLQKWPGLKCLFVSGYTAEVMTDDGVLVLKKPWTREVLAETVRGMMRSDPHSS